MWRTLKISMFLIGLGLPLTLSSQVDFNRVDDDLGNIEDKFQEHFFEALKQKAIENYDRSIIALQKCLNLDDSKSVVYFEIGKNYVQLKNYGAAEDALKKAIELDPDNEWYLDELYGVYVESEEFDKAIATVEQLVGYHSDYKEDLANLYFRMDRFKEALELLDELDEQLGVSESREELRNRIYNATGADQDRIDYLETRIRNKPDNEDNYLNLIYRYSQTGQKQKAFETAERLLKRKPESQLVHLALYKFYLDDAKPDKAIESMKIVIKSPTIKADAKAMVLNDFVQFVQQNPRFESELLEVTTEVVSDESGESDAELAQYYLKTGDKVKALEFYKKAYDKDPDNFDLFRNMLLLQVDSGENKEVVSLTGEALDLYPAQPILYLLNGVAENKLNNPKAAIEVLMTGLDYIIDDAIMEADFYKQLSLAYKLDNNIVQSQAFERKAQEVLNKND